MSYPEIPYKHESPLAGKLVMIPALTALFLPLLNLDRFASFWASCGPFLRSVLLLTAACIIVAACEILFQRTVFTAEGIEHRTKFGTRYFKHYDQINSFSKGYISDVRVDFDDGRKLTFDGDAARKVWYVLYSKAPEKCALPAAQ